MIGFCHFEFSKDFVFRRLRVKSKNGRGDSEGLRAGGEGVEGEQAGSLDCSKVVTYPEIHVFHSVIPANAIRAFSGLAGFRVVEVFGENLWIHHPKDTATGSKSANTSGWPQGSHLPRMAAMSPH